MNRLFLTFYKNTPLSPCHKLPVKRRQCRILSALLSIIPCLFFFFPVCVYRKNHRQLSICRTWKLHYGSSLLPPSCNNPIIPCSLRDTQAKVEGFKRYRAPTFAFRSCVCLRFDGEWIRVNYSLSKHASFLMFVGRRTAV